MEKSIYQTISLTIVFFVILGVVYPLVTTFVGGLLFKKQSQGSLLTANQVVVGSRLIGQNFTQAKYFHGRPSSAGSGYDATHSSASNLSATNKALSDKIQGSIELVLKENPGLKTKDIPVDLVTSSASGLDPDISLEGALIQVPRVARERHLDENKIKILVETKSQSPTLGFIGQKTVNVLELNLALDNL
jgi:K+-transporting ATPase ATPase C chain